MSPNHPTNRASHQSPEKPIDPAFQELVDYFLEELPLRIQRLEQAAGEHDLETIRTVAHQLKGCAAGYGFPELGEQAALIEGCVRVPDLQTVEIAKIRAGVNDLVALCQSYCKRT
jgi:HPt (histidine-containing phosphotransfer) domain-containing protein